MSPAIPSPVRPVVAPSGNPVKAWQRQASYRDSEEIERGTWVSRVTWGIMLVIAVATVITAGILTPDPAGHGTHTQLGLPPCGFLVITGYPCPGCGLTTCFSAMAHFDPITAAMANPFGVMLFLVTLASIPISALGLWRGWGVISVLDRLRADRWALLLATCSVMVWLIRIVTIYVTA
jgi:hypothetical protein